MDVLVGIGNVLRNGSKARNIQGRLGGALRAIFSAFCAVCESTIHARTSVSISVASSHDRNERIQHIRSFEFAVAAVRCRSKFTAPATRALRR